MLQKKILIIDDSDFYANCIRDVLSAAGYNIIRADRGESGLRLVSSEKPDMVLLDVIMPDMDGFEVCRILRVSESNNLMPIMMLTSQDHQEDKLTGLELGADDYIVKPFNQRELLSRVVNTLRRIDRNRSANPLTGLPGNLEIAREIDSRISKGSYFAAIYADLDNFKAYNDVYGFARGDTAIRLTADTIHDAVAACGTPDDFIGHIGGDDFFVISTPEHAESICRGIINRFDESIRSIYSSEDLQRGLIITDNRIGETSEYPIMSISLAVVTNRYASLTNAIELTDVAAELKKQAKSIKGSNYVLDRRKKPVRPR